MKRLALILLALACSFQYGFTQNDEKPDADKKKKLDKLKPKISGLVQVHCMAELNTNGDSVRDPSGFRILRARLQLKGNVTQRVNYQLMIDARSPEHSGLLRDAYIGIALPKNQTLRIGQQKTQFGYENRQSIAELYVVNRSELSDALSRGYNLRDIGLGLVGKVPLKNNLYLEDAITLTNGARMNIAGPWEFSSTKNVFGRMGIGQKTGRVKWSVGISGATGHIHDLGDHLADPADDFEVKIKRLGTDFAFQNKYLTGVSEFAIGTNLENDTLSTSMGYAITLVGKTKYHVGPLGRFDFVDDEFRRFTVGAYYGKPKDKFRVLVNYEFRGGIRDVPGGHDDRLYVQCQVAF